MSRIAKKPIDLPQGVDIELNGNRLSVKGKLGTLARDLHPYVVVNVADVVTVSPKAVSDMRFAWAISGTTRALINNMCLGVSVGFERKLKLVGVGYRAEVKGKAIHLALGFSHPVVYQLPEGVTAECPSQTEVILKSIDKQLVGQVAAEIRAYRPPEPYKGKGVRYADEIVKRKEVKKK